MFTFHSFAQNYNSFTFAFFIHYAVLGQLFLFRGLSMPCDGRSFLFISSSTAFSVVNSLHPIDLLLSYLTTSQLFSSYCWNKRCKFWERYNHVLVCACVCFVWKPFRGNKKGFQTKTNPREPHIRPKTGFNNDFKNVRVKVF